MKDDNIQISEHIKSLILLQIGMKHSTKYVTAGMIKGYCSRFMGILLDWEESQELADEYNNAA